MNNKQLTELFPEIEPFDSGLLSLDALHTMCWEQSGNPNGVPVLFLHGGPGAGSTPAHRRFLIPTIIGLLFLINVAQDVPRL
jgi:proline iminopeptidase